MNIMAISNTRELISKSPKKLYAPIPIIKIIKTGTSENNIPFFSCSLLLDINKTIKGIRQEIIIKIVEKGSISLNSIILFDVIKIWIKQFIKIVFFKIKSKNLYLVSE